MMPEVMIEQGPIRPPSEAGSLLLRFTRNCPWNQCLFCPVYKGRTFSRRPAADIKKDIDAVAAAVEQVREFSWKLGYGGVVNGQVLAAVATRPEMSQLHRQVAHWLVVGEGRVFLQDANTLIMDPAELADLVAYLRQRLPGVQRVTSYARSKTLCRRSLADMQLLRQAGLDRIHIGMESGYDPLLRYMRKGATAAEHLQAGLLVREAGMSLSEYIMPGLGGRRWWRQHALASAKVLNQINPDFIRLRTLRVPRSTPLFAKVEAGEVELLEADEVVEEIRLFISNLEGIESVVVSDHIMNLLEEVGGPLPAAKDTMLAVIDAYLQLEPWDRLVFKVGRWGGAFHCLADLDDGRRRAKIEALVKEWEAAEPGGAMKMINAMADQYI